MSTIQFRMTPGIRQALDGCLERQEVLERRQNGDTITTIARDRDVVPSRISQMTKKAREDQAYPLYELREVKDEPQHAGEWIQPYAASRAPKVGENVLIQDKPYQVIEVQPNYEHGDEVLCRLQEIRDDHPLSIYIRRAMTEAQPFA